MTQLSQDMQEAIRKSLPEQTAHELKEYLNNAENNAFELQKIRLKFSQLEEENNRLTQHILKAGEIGNRESLVISREKEIEHRLIKISHTEEILKLNQEHAVDIRHTALDMMRTVFKSQPLGHAFTKNTSEYVPGNQHNGYAAYTKANTETTTSKEITE